MASQTIPNLPAATSLNGTEFLWGVQNGSDVRLTTAQIVTLFGSTIGINQLFTAYLQSLPTTLPAIAGQPWNNGGVICIS